MKTQRCVGDSSLYLNSLRAPGLVDRQYLISSQRVLMRRMLPFGGEIWHILGLVYCDGMPRRLEINVRALSEWRAVRVHMQCTHHTARVVRSIPPSEGQDAIRGGSHDAHGATRTRTVSSDLCGHLMQ